MSMFNPYWKSNYDELITYYPRFYRDVLEMDAILRTEGKLADDIRNGIELILSNNFIDSADGKTIVKLEEFLCIVLTRHRSLEERRKFIKNLFIGQGKISATVITKIIQGFINAEVKIHFEPDNLNTHNILYINIYFHNSKEENSYMSDIRMLINRKIPAHIGYKITFCYRVDGKAFIYTGLRLSCKRKKIRTEVKNYGLE